LLSAIYSIYPLRETWAMKLGRFFTIVTLLGALMASGCANTIRGFGKDAANTVDATQSAGKNVAEAAE
jgi:entericidin B